MKLELQPLPYAKDALEPHISARTVDIHYTKHHQGYVDKLAAEIAGTPEADLSLEEFLQNATGHRYDLAAQIWNHDFYWKSLSPEGGQPTQELARAIDRDFGSLAELKEQLAAVAKGEFGSGWAWLVANPITARLGVMSTSDAQNPLSRGDVPLLTIDVWEHAYYLDYQHDRGQYVESVIDHLLNWQFASQCLARAGNA